MNLSSPFHLFLIQSNKTIDKARITNEEILDFLKERTALVTACHVQSLNQEYSGSTEVWRRSLIRLKEKAKKTSQE